MNPSAAYLKDMRMDVKDLLNYRTVVEAKRKKAIDDNDMTTLVRLGKQLDIMDMVFETIWVATMMDAVPEFKALTGGDFDIPSLKIVLPQYATKDITEDTQIAIDYVEDESASNPATNDEDFMLKIKELLSKSAAKNIPIAIEIYNKHTGKDLMPADAYAEIKNLLPDVNVIRILDKAISTQYRTNGPIMVYKMLKGWAPNFSETEIGRIAEDAVRRTIKIPECTKSEKDQLEAILNSNLSREEIIALKMKKENVELIKAVHPGMSDLTAQHRVGYVAVAFNPQKRFQIEGSSGRKPYVEKGY